MNLARYRSRNSGGPELLPFHHEPLRDNVNGIRLVKIKPGTGTTRVSIDLVESFLPKAGQQPRDPYDALSYTWGTKSRDKAILCNGRLLEITETLLQALRRFRDEDHVVTLWIDQICIWQKSIPERNHQVSMMGRIFTGARKVLVWLGPHDEQSRGGIALAEQLVMLCRQQNLQSLDANHLGAHGLPGQREPKWRALAAILRRKWFWRTWVVQEVVLNPNVELVVGESTPLSWDDLEAVVDLVVGPTSRQWQIDPTLSAWELPFTRINRIRMRHQKRPDSAQSISNFLDDLSSIMVQEPEQATDEGNNADDIDLLDLLLMSRGLGATDPRDKVYAFLGLSTHEMEVDYELSVEHIFSEYALHVVGEVTRLASHVEGNRASSKTREVQKMLVLLSCAGIHNVRPQRFSWVPDWTTDLAPRPFVFDSRFSTGGDELEIDWDYDTGLRVCGKLLDTVEVAGTVHLTFDLETSDSTARNMIDRWWLEASGISQQRTVQSPGSTMRLGAFQALCRDLAICKHGFYKGDGTSEPQKSNSSRPRRRRSLLDAAGYGLDRDEIHDAADARQTLTLGPTRGRVFFTTASGYIGLAPYGTVEGDLVYIVLGSSVPYTVRPHRDGRSFALVGEAYVQGIMNGEALAMDNVNPVDYIFIR